MKVLTYTSYKEHYYGQYTVINDSITVNGCQVGLAQKNIILLSKISLIVCKAGKRTGVANTEFIKFTLSDGAYSIGDFNAKIKIAILQQRQDWEPPQIKDSELAIPENYLFMADNIIFIALGIQDNCLERTSAARSTLPPRSYKTSLDTLLPPQLLSLHCKQINKVKKELDGQPSSFSTFMHVSNYKASFSPIFSPVFLELVTHHIIWILRYLMKTTVKLSR